MTPTRTQVRPTRVLTTLLALALLLSACAGAETEEDPESAPDTGPPPPIAAAPVTVVGDRILREGQPWWFVGYNSFVWSGDCGEPDERMSPSQVDAWFASMRHDGHGAVRLFFQPGWDLARLDAARESARRYGVAIVLVLDDALGECGGTRKTPEWFADPAAVQRYRDHLTMLVTRYRGDPTFAWFEYLNEPDDAGGALRPFYDEMGALAKRIDPGRLFSSGTIAPYATGGDDAFEAIHESPGVDIASLHEYDADEVESHHGPEVRNASAGKPVVVGEFGIEAGPGCPTSYADRAARFRAKTAAYLGLGYVGALAWAWQPGGSGGCDLENLDADRASQAVLRRASP